MFVRCYLQNDSNIKRGTNTKEGHLIPNPDMELWFNYESGIIFENNSKGDCKSYSCVNLPGDPSFTVRYFKDNKECKTYKELLGIEERRVAKVAKKVTKKQLARAKEIVILGKKELKK